MPPGFFAHLLLFVVMTSLCLVRRPLEVPPRPCGTVLEYHFLQPVWSQGPSRRCDLQGFCWCLAESSCDFAGGHQGRGNGAAGFGRRRGPGRHTAYDPCPITCLQGWRLSVPQLTWDLPKGPWGNAARLTREFLDVKASLPASWLFVLHPQGPRPPAADCLMLTWLLVPSCLAWDGVVHELG